MERIIRFTPAWDKRSDDPKKNYGVHGVELGFYLKGEKGTVQFKIFTNWFQPHVAKEFKHRDWDFDDLWCPFKPLPADLGYHSPVPMYEDHHAVGENCEWTGGVCYYDGSSLAAEKIFEILTESGDEGVWKALEDYYAEIFMPEIKEIIESANSPQDSSK